MGGQFPPERWWSGCSGIQPESALFTGGQFPPESGGQFDRILHMTTLITAEMMYGNTIPEMIAGCKKLFSLDKKGMVQLAS